MNISRGLCVGVAAAALLGMVAGLAPAGAAPLNPASTAMTSTAGSDIVAVRGRHGDAAAAAAAAGIAGLIIGGIAASQQRDYYGGPYYGRGYYAPAPVYVAPVGPGPGWEAYCFSRYRSFDPATGTYRGYDGRRYYCQ
ncbi:BA14K family protein [Rhodopseudomonas sp. P2A-2r]|uniref:BA14K family protein n=1 Tax=unclassified Rhodopseudomonas TaxID=2638247 RepID=UPI002233E84D|nr:BA14K family protein [Rhodopseudomonas sp. P2A-2r]UZE50136.1 BA14K family protein [Rhodopseudomonas sp. P2A-2r]